MQELKNLNILYVEDEVEVSKEVINNLNYFVNKIIHCRNGKEGLETFIHEEKNLNLIITDVLMPILDGKEMVDKIRDINTSIPILYTSAFNNNEFLDFVGEQSGVHNLSKPIDLEELIKLIIEIVTKK